MFKKLIACLSLIASLCINAQSAGVTLAWDQCCNTNIVGYVLYYTTNTVATPVTNVFTAFLDDCGINRPGSTNVYYGNWNLATAQNVVGITNATTSVTNLVKGAKYFFVVTAKTATLESDKSNEISYTAPLFPTNVPPSKVQGVRIIAIQ